MSTINTHTTSISDATWLPTDRGHTPLKPTQGILMFRSAIGLIGLTYLILAAAQPTLAGTIHQEEVSTYLQVFGNAPIGQTFTAEDEYVSRFAFNFDDFNNEFLNGSTIVRLYEGDTIVGDPVYVDAVELTPGSQGLAFFSILPVALNIGATYTLEVERFNPRWGLGVYQHHFSDGQPIPGHEDYTGGHAIINGQPALGYDLSFRVIPLVPGDGNIDGLVTGIDYLLWASHYGDDPADNPPGPPSNGDYNADGRVDALDYFIWADSFVNTNSVTAPEPSSLSLTLLGVALTVGRRGRKRRTRRRR